jgi:hypothetical protein
LDANLLVLWVLGRFGKGKFSQLKRVSQFDYRHYRMLCYLATAFRGLISTPYVLSQASDLTTLTGEDNEVARAYLKDLILPMQDSYQPAAELVQHPVFRKLGLADTSVLNAGNPRTTILTTDLELYRYAQAQGVPALNFNHLRPLQNP